MLSVVGLGPAGPELVSTAVLAVLDEADQVFLRTARHPAASVVTARRPDAASFDGRYEESSDFAAVYEAIVAELCTAARTSLVCYAVPGSPVVCERTVELLRSAAADGSLELRVLPAMSYLDLAWDRLALDPVRAQVVLADAADFSVAAARGAPVLVSQAWSRGVLSEMKLAVEEPGDDDVAVILHHLGLPDEVVVTVPWPELDRTLEPDHLTAVFVPSLSDPPAAALVELDATVAHLRRHCPWDRMQTHGSLLRHLLEESYEAIEAIEALGDDPAGASAEVAAHVEEELGDLLGQVVFHARLATEEGLFALSDVVRSLTRKLVTRHPHVFGDASASSAAEVVENWERSKDLAKGRAHLFEGMPAAMPALARAEKAERKLKSVGLGWERSQVGDEELAGILARCVAAAADEEADADEPAGEALLLLTRRLAAAGVDAEAALRRALSRLGARLETLEEEAAADGLRLAEWVKRAGDVPPLPPSLW